MTSSPSMPDPTYAVVDDKKKTQKFPSKYGNICTPANKKDLGHNGEYNLESMYSVLHTIPSPALTHTTSTTVESGYSNEDSHMMYSVLHRGPNTQASGFSQALPQSSYTENCKVRKLSSPLYVGWLIATIAMVLIIMVLITVTTVGYIRLYKVESELETAQTINNLMSNGNRNDSTFPTVTIPTTGTTPTTPAKTTTTASSISTLTTSSIATPTTPPAASISAVLANSSYFHLEDYFSTNKNLFGLVVDCMSGGQSLDQCISRLLAQSGNEIIPAPSCRELYKILPNNSDYYWVAGLNGASVRVYCEMKPSCGNISRGLTRVVSINEGTQSQYCTGNISFDVNGCFKTSPKPGCSGITFPIANIPHSHICGVIQGTSFGTMEGFQGIGRSSTTTIDDNYVDGISLTATSQTHRTHIWTFSARSGNCSIGVPEYVGQYHSCIRDLTHCPTDSCTTMFHRGYHNTLPEVAEVRFCQDENRDPNNEGVYMEMLELYVW